MKVPSEKIVVEYSTSGQAYVYVIAQASNASCALRRGIKDLAPASSRLIACALGCAGRSRASVERRREDCNSPRKSTSACGRSAPPHRQAQPRRPRRPRSAPRHVLGGVAGCWADATRSSSRNSAVPAGSWLRVASSGASQNFAQVLVAPAGWDTNEDTKAACH